MAMRNSGSLATLVLLALVASLMPSPLSFVAP
eukprot:CAMPEP_0170636738 /NCGR_PEP_ID=MMETSP0224-20130122/38001_1 /TAXON_ID=285029 /ORGANISM="Togula jolla, Strain CCCM 725" /LENGTH=31 /DNA_ID= /DNA_START= /DNA_END= /DNA_ORIENTATION=